MDAFLLSMACKLAQSNQADANTTSRVRWHEAMAFSELAVVALLSSRNAADNIATKSNTRATHRGDFDDATEFAELIRATRLSKMFEVFSNDSSNFSDQIEGEDAFLHTSITARREDSNNASPPQASSKILLERDLSK